MCVSYTKIDFDPTKSEIDLSYLNTRGRRDQYEIPSCFEECRFQKGHSFQARVPQIYDPWKFWIVIHHRELEAFQQYLFRYYYIHHDSYRIPSNKLAKNLYCVAFVDQQYYRGVIVGFPISTKTNDDKQVTVYFIDYGLVSVIDIKDVYYMSEACLQVHQFALRASLAGICPLKRGSWSSKDVVTFHNLVAEQVVVGVVVYTDTKRQTLGVHLGLKIDKRVDLIHEALIAQKCARFFNEKAEEEQGQEKAEEKQGQEKAEEEQGQEKAGLMKYPYLFPTHASLENGIFPAKLSDTEYQEQLTSSPYHYHYKSLN